MNGFSKALVAGITTALISLTLNTAQAATHDIALQGVVGNGSFFSSNDGFTQYDQWSLALTGLSEENAFVIANGDTINATVTLDQRFTIPASDRTTSFVLFLSGSSIPWIISEVAGTTSLFDGVTAGTTGGTTTSTRGALANAVSLFSPENGAITFDSFTSNFTVTTLAEPVTVEYASISYTLFNNIAAVPEPATTAMLFAGLGVMGLLRRRRKHAVA